MVELQNLIKKQKQKNNPCLPPPPSCHMLSTILVPSVADMAILLNLSSKHRSGGRAVRRAGLCYYIVLHALIILPHPYYNY